MNESLTRRAQEYFEVFDELHAEGYVSHEEWMATPLKERESIAKMTNHMIQDLLVEKGYSRGSPNELLKYRKRWLQKRGILESQIGQKDKPASDDPIYQMVESVRLKLEKEAEDKVDEAKQTADQKVNEANERYEDIKKELLLTRKTLDALQADHRSMKEENRAFTSTLKESEKKNTAFETQLTGLEKSSAELLKKEKTHHEEMMQNKDNTIKRLEDDLHKSREDYKSQLSDLKQQSEDQRHQLIVEVRSYKDKSQKLEKECHQLQLAEQRLKSQYQSLEKQSKQLKATYDMLNQDYKKKATEFLESEKERTALKTKLAALENKLLDEKHEREIAHNKLLSAQAHFGKLEGIVEEQKRRIEYLNSQIKDKHKRDTRHVK